MTLTPERAQQIFKITQDHFSKRKYNIKHFIEEIEKTQHEEKLELEQQLKIFCQSLRVLRYPTQLDITTPIEVLIDILYFLIESNLGRMLQD